jgi:predicted nucleic acid-binding protein
VIVYAESSAVLAWLLGESAASTVRRLLADAERVVASALTPLECARALARGVATGQLPAADARAAARLLDDASRGWALLEMTGPALERARRPFPAEPVRTLDAIHLASALEFQDALGRLTLLCLDERIRANATALGLTAAPRSPKTPPQP